MVVAVVVAYYLGPIIGKMVAGWGGAFAGAATGTLSTFGAFTAGAITGAVIGFANGVILTGSLSGGLKGAAFGALGGGLAGAIGNYFGHDLSVITGGGMKAVVKSIVHGISRAAISKLQGGKWSAGFWSGFVSSAFSPGSTLGGKGTQEGFALRTTIAAVIGGTASRLSGGKFANGAVSGAFVHMFNAEGGSIFEKIKNGLSKSFSTLAERNGEIREDISQAVIGAYNGTKEAMVNSPTYAKIPLYLAGTILTVGIANGVYVAGSYYMMANPNMVINGAQLVQGYFSPMTANTPVGRIGGGLKSFMNLKGLFKCILIYYFLFL